MYSNINTNCIFNFCVLTQLTSDYVTYDTDIFCSCTKNIKRQDSLLAYSKDLITKIQI